VAKIQVKDDLGTHSFPECAQFITHLTLERRLSAYTARNYKYAIDRFFLWLSELEGRRLSFKEVTKLQCRSYIIESQAKYSRRTLRNHISGIRTFYKFCQVRNWVTVKPRFIICPSQNRTNLCPKYLQKNKFLNYWEQPNFSSKEGGGEFKSVRDLLILELLYAGGLRVSELVGINYGDINHADASIKISGKGGKQRHTPIGNRTLKTLIKFRDSFAKDCRPLAPVIINKNGKRLSVRSVQILLKNYLRSADLPDRYDSTQTKTLFRNSPSE
jgi:integrase/recombinase XerC